MANRDQPTEYGGKPMPNGIQPRRTPAGKAGHRATSEEEMRLIKTTYQPGGLEAVNQEARLDNGEAFSGLLPRSVQEKLAPKPKLFIEDMPDEA